ncbi:MAG: error-prone DNA polymerase [Gammaproteobacteria bacterium]|nr:error-prone DNA polymerase [Gammaproteobacteria bacterium]
MSTLTDYAELHCLSNFSFLRGASHPEELVGRAAALGYTALAITDECSLAGVVRAHLAARERQIRLIVGSEFALSDGPRLVLLATDRSSYGALSELITCGRRAAGKGKYSLRRADVERIAPRCLALWLPEDPCGSVPDDSEPGLWLKRCFPGSTWIAVELVRDGLDGMRLACLANLATQTGLPLVASGDVHMHVRSRRALQDTLTAIRLGVPLDEAGCALNSNGERHLRTRRVLARIYPPELLAETKRIAERCHFSLDELRYEYPEELVPAGETPAVYLERLVAEGLNRRWPAGVPDRVRQLVAYELALIAELGYEPYFLTVYDIVRFARSRDIICQGRGSAANSAVCYCLGITEVDPDRIQTLFERFISRERNEPPDIDVDFEHDRREEVIQYVFGKYGRSRAALTATVITYRLRSAVRDVGRALGLAPEQLDRLTASLQWWDGRNVVPQRLAEAGFDPENPAIQRLLARIQELLGFPRHLSQHVGGFVIARGPLSSLVPIENAAMPERTVIQWDKDDLDALGLLKVDCLALGMLSAIHRAFDLIEKVRGRRLTMASVPAEDPAVYAMIRRADTAGVFQIESRAQMAMLPRLRPSCFYDLVIEVAIVRPGPIQGGMVHPYLRRRRGEEPVSYPSKAVRKVLMRTLGVPIFQEQVIKLAMVAAGFSAGEADRLRRAMAAWRRRGGLETFEQRLIDGMRENGYAEEFARQIFAQIRGFGEYGFPESHAASFALLVYVSAWLKCHEPAVFLCALLNSQPMGFYSPAQLVQDARRHSVEVRPVDVCVSSWDCTLETGRVSAPAVRLGLGLVRGFSRSGARRLVEVRTQAPFTGVADLARRARLVRRDLDALAAAGALAGLAGHRHLARWAVAGVEPDLPLLEGVDIAEARPLLRPPTEGEDIVADYASIGLSLHRHPLALLRLRLERLGACSATVVHGFSGGSRVCTAGLVTGRQRPGSARGVIFVTLEDETGHINVIVRPAVAEHERKALLGARLLVVTGEIQRDGEVLHVIARHLEDRSELLGVLATHSRDFH